MGKKKIEGLGDQAVSKFFEQPEGLPEVERTKVGRPRTIYREYEKSSQEGLRDGFTRATFIAVSYTHLRIIFDETHNMIKQSPDISKYIKKRKSDLYFPMTMSKFQPLGKNSDTLDGLNACLLYTSRCV